jgi:RNA polymerase sigma-70 factor (sigma-E family)
VVILSPVGTRPGETSTDSGPVSGAAAAEPPSFEEYVAARGAALVRFAILITGDDHRAEDLVQDALAKAYLRWSWIGRADRPDVYVRRMLVNASRSWWRRRSNRELPVERTTDRPAAGDHGAESAERDEMWRLISRLPHRQRAVLVLRYYEDLDDATIAETLDCSTVTVRTHAMRALTALRGYYGAGPAKRGRRRNQS